MAPYPPPPETSLPTRPFRRYLRLTAAAALIVLGAFTLLATFAFTMNERADAQSVECSPSGFWHVPGHPRVPESLGIGCDEPKPTGWILDWERPGFVRLIYNGDRIVQPYSAGGPESPILTTIATASGGSNRALNLDNNGVFYWAGPNHRVVRGTDGDCYRETRINGDWRRSNKYLAPGLVNPNSPEHCRRAAWNTYLRLQGRPLLGTWNAGQFPGGSPPASLAVTSAAAAERSLIYWVDENNRVVTDSNGNCYVEERADGQWWSSESYGIGTNNCRMAGWNAYQRSQERATFNRHSPSAFPSGNPPDARVGELVSNVRQPGGTANLWYTRDIAQPFTTGTHSRGYVLTEIQLYLALTRSWINDPHRVVEIWSSEDGEPGTKLATLSTITRLVQGANTFIAPVQGVVLAPATTYFVLIDFGGRAGSRPYIENTDSDDESAATGTGWSIGDGSLYKSQSATSWTSAATPRKIGIEGYAIDR